ICVPAFPLQAVCFEHWLDYPVGEIVEIECSSNRVREHPATRNLRLDGIEDGSQRFDYRHNSGVVIIFMCLRLMIEVSPPYRPSDSEHITIVIFPPLSSDFALPQSRESRH